jgi:hypothetical protein
MTGVAENQIASLAEIAEDCCSCVLHSLPIVLATESLIHLLQENRPIQSVHMFSQQTAERRRDLRYLLVRGRPRPPERSAKASRGS